MMAATQALRSGAGQAAIRKHTRRRLTVFVPFDGAACDFESVLRP